MIVSDTGWRHSNPYRCVTITNRTIVFDPENTSDQEINDWKDLLEKELPGGQEQWARREGWTLKFHSFCDSSD